jgi:hypothetical protein
MAGALKPHGPQLLSNHSPLISKSLMCAGLQVGGAGSSLLLRDAVLGGYGAAVGPRSPDTTTGNKLCDVSSPGCNFYFWTVRAPPPSPSFPVNLPCFIFLIYFSSEVVVRVLLDAKVA